MSKELNIIDTFNTVQHQDTDTPEVTTLDELTLALIGGGAGVVDLGG